VTTVLGNLIDNAVNAAVAGSATDRWVEVEVLDEPHDDGGTLLSVVADSGDGLAPGTDAEAVFAEGYTTAKQPGQPDGADSAEQDGAEQDGAGRAGYAGGGVAGGGRRGGGQGLGLALARKLARRRGGDIRILESGTRGGPGAVFMASLPRTTAGTGAGITDGTRPEANDGTLTGTAGRTDTSEKDDHA
jgi:two-component system CitB family sensor kinase